MHYVGENWAKKGRGSGLLSKIWWTVTPHPPKNFITITYKLFLRYLAQRRTQTDGHTDCDENITSAVEVITKTLKTRHVKTDNTAYKCIRQRCRITVSCNRVKAKWYTAYNYNTDGRRHSQHIQVSTTKPVYSQSVCEALQAFTDNQMIHGCLMANY